MDFFKFWGACILEGWQLGFSAFSFIEAACAVFLGILAWRKKLHKKAKKWEEPAMKWAACILVVAFTTSAVFVSPFSKHKQAVSQANGYAAQIVSLSKDLKSLSAENKGLQDRKTLAAQERLAADMREEYHATRKLLLGIASSPDPKEAALRELAKPMPVASGLIVNGKLDKEAAKTAFMKMDSEVNASWSLSKKGTQEFTNEINLVWSYALTNLTQVLQDLAASNGDTIKQESKPMSSGDQGYVISLAKNTNWNFRFRINTTANSGKLEVQPLKPDGNSKHGLQAGFTAYKGHGRIQCTLKWGPPPKTEQVPLDGGQAQQKVADYLGILVSRHLELEPLIDYSGKQ